MTRAAILAALAAAASAGAQAAERPLPDRGFDVQHYRVELDLDDVARGFEGRTRVDLVATRPGLRRVVLDAETFVVEGVRSGPRELAFEQGDGALDVALPRPLERSEALSIEVRYRAVDVHVDPERFGMPEGYALGLGFEAETERHPAVASTLSFPEGARHWFPCLDHPSDRATQELVASVRSDWRVLSNGRLVSESVDAARGRRTVHWSLERPQPTYLAVLVAGPYVVLEDAFGDVPVSHWVFPDDVADAPRSFARTPEILAFLETLFGHPYPWSKYAQVTVPTIGGGLEATTAIELSQRTLHAARSHDGFGSEWLVAHEAAHQWWGDLVSYRDWGETWLSESFATWSEYRWAAHDLGPLEGALNLEEKRRAYLAEARDVHRRPMVWDGWRFPDDNFDRHTYQRGAVVIEMLADLLGEAAWREAMALFLERNAFRPVTTDDLVAAIRDATGEDVAWFVDQWVRRPGHPVLGLEREWDAAAGELVLRVRQLQEREDGTPVYRLPLRFAIAAGGEVHEPEVWLDDVAGEWRFPLPGPPDYVAYDPRDRLLAEWRDAAGVAEWLTRLERRDAVGRRRAALALAPHADTPAVRAALLRAAVLDPFRGVREAAVRTLGAPRGARERAALLERAVADPHGEVRAACLAQLGRAETPAPLELLEERARSDPSDRARAEAVRAAGRAGASRTFLEEALGWRSGRDVVAAAAREALEAR